MAAAQITVKIAQISKDFNIKTKDVLDAYKDLGIEKKSGGSVDGEELEIFLKANTILMDVGCMLFANVSKVDSLVAANTRVVLAGFGISNDESVLVSVFIQPSVIPL